MTSLFFSQSSEIINIAKAFIPEFKVPSLPQVIFVDPQQIMPINNMMVLKKSSVKNCRRETLLVSDKRETYIVFNISRADDLVRNFRITGPLAENSNKYQLIAGRQILASTDDVKTPLGSEWFPIVAMPYKYLSIWVKLIDENGLVNGVVEYDACLLPNNERRELGRNPILLSYYKALIVEGSLGDNVDDTEKYLKSKFSYITSRDFSANPIGRVEVSENSYNVFNQSENVSMTANRKSQVRITSSNIVIFNRFGNAFRDVIVFTNKKSRVEINSNDAVIFEATVEANIKTNITDETVLPYPIYNEIGFRVIPLDGNSNDLLYSVEREECEINLPNNIPLLIPEMRLTMYDGCLGKSESMIPTSIKQSEKITEVIPL